MYVDTAHSARSSMPCACSTVFRASLPSRTPPTPSPPPHTPFVVITVEPRFNEPLYNEVFRIPNDIRQPREIKSQENIWKTNLDITNLRFNKPIFQVPWHLVKSRFHCIHVMCVSPLWRNIIKGKGPFQSPSHIPLDVSCCFYCIILQGVYSNAEVNLLFLPTFISLYQWLHTPEVEPRVAGEWFERFL